MGAPLLLPFLVGCPLPVISSVPDSYAYGPAGYVLYRCRGYRHRDRSARADATPVKPVVTSARAIPGTLGPSGGTLEGTCTVKGASTCEFAVPSRQHFPIVYSHNTRSCLGGLSSAHVTKGSNSAPIRRTVAFAIRGTNAGHTSAGRFDVVLGIHATAPRPSPPGRLLGQGSSRRRSPQPP